MVGSSARTAALGPLSMLGAVTGSAGSTGGGGGGAGGKAASTCGFGDGAGAATVSAGFGSTGGGGAGGAGGGLLATTGGGGRGAGGGVVVGRAPPAPGMNEKSSASDEDIHGTCSPREARVTPILVRFSVSSAIRSGTRISLSSSWTNRLWSLPASETTEASAAEYITSVPFGAMTGVRPAEKLRNLRSNGLRLEASTSAILTPAPRVLSSPRMVSRLKPSRRTSDSVQIWASTGIMKLWRADWMPNP